MTRLLLLAALLALVPGLPSAAGEDPYEIVPGVRLGPLRLGSAYEDLVRGLGDPEVAVPTPRGTAAFWPARGVLVMERDGRLTGVGFLTTPTVVPDTAADSLRVRTRSGVGLGATREFVRGRLGPPTLTSIPDLGFLEPWGVAPRSIERWNYRVLRLYVDFLGPKAVGIGVYSDAAAASGHGTDGTILPGRRVGPIPLGVPAHYVVQVIGQPAEERAGPVSGGVALRWARPPDLLEIWTDASFRIEGVLVRRFRPSAGTLVGEIATYRTPEGVTLGQRAEEARRRLGVPAERQASEALFAVNADRTLTGARVERWWYPSGLTVEIHDGVVSGLGSTRPRAR